MQLQAEI